MEIIAFLLGVAVAMCITKYKVDKLLQQLENASKAGNDEMWSHGVFYAMHQIKKMI